MMVMVEYSTKEAETRTHYTREPELNRLGAHTIPSSH